MTGRIEVDTTPRRGADGEACRAILDALPEWFGMPEANAAYEQTIPTLDTFLATVDGGLVGFVSLVHHNPEACEIWVMAVRREHHRTGIGTRLMHACEAWLRERDVRYAQVKTLGPSREYEPYERTRAFYRTVGYVPIEEFKTLWDEENPALLLVKALQAG